jgi:hypothetical protein
VICFWPALKKIKGGLWDHLAVCVPPHNFVLGAYEITLLSRCLCVLHFFIFYAASILSKEWMPLILPRTCFLFVCWSCFSHMKLETVATCQCEKGCQFLSYNTPWVVTATGPVIRCSHIYITWQIQFVLCQNTKECWQCIPLCNILLFSRDIRVQVYVINAASWFMAETSWSVPSYELQNVRLHGACMMT